MQGCIRKTRTVCNRCRYDAADAALFGFAPDHGRSASFPGRVDPVSHAPECIVRCRPEFSDSTIGYFLMETICNNSNACRTSAVSSGVMRPGLFRLRRHSRRRPFPDIPRPHAQDKSSCLQYRLHHRIVPPRATPCLRVPRLACKLILQAFFYARHTRGQTAS